MFLVYNFSNSNVKYSLQRMSEHIELMGQLSSVTVKFPRVSQVKAAAFRNKSEMEALLEQKWSHNFFGKDLKNLLQKFREMPETEQEPMGPS